ncbi:unnamed protein product [Cyprideis torosa]|uniref:Uncharacterized protein n=1 Tax=Cyprideis torosa TaxID=163714 RepID=A0A7R8ZQJ3_9CRUS|nr:unnamed protein product [Cyprideis torosa]CAG0901534.1 unnamed protein product [Cyprideis torosa]
MGKAFWLLCLWQEFLPVPAPPSEEPRKNPYREKTFRIFLLFQSEEVTKKSIPGKCLSLFCTGNRIITGNRISTGNRIICTGGS